MENNEQVVKGHHAEHIIIILLLIAMLALVSSLLKVQTPDIREGKFLIPTNAFYNATQKPLLSPDVKK